MTDGKGGKGGVLGLNTPSHSCDSGGNCECLCSAIATHVESVPSMGSMCAGEARSSAMSALLAPDAQSHLVLIFREAPPGL